MVIEDKQSNVNISNNIFKENEGFSEGGAIKWAKAMPFISENNIFENNKAIYGPNIASYALRICLQYFNLRAKSSGEIIEELLYENPSNISKLIINNISSGNDMKTKLVLKITDHYGNIINLNEGY